MADWQEKIDNPDPRIKWAMDIMDQEGRDFETTVGKVMAPLGASAIPLSMNFLRNATSRLPLRTNMFGTLLVMPVFAFAGLGYRKWVDNQHQEEEAVVKHYILTHPERFPEPKKVKYIDHIEAWRPVRW